MKNVTVHGACVTAMLLCCLVSVAAISGFCATISIFAS